MKKVLTFSHLIFLANQTQTSLIYCCCLSLYDCLLQFLTTYRFFGLRYIHAKLLIFHHQRLFDWFQFFWWFDSNFTFMLSLIKLCMQHGLHLYCLIVQFFSFYLMIFSHFFSFYFPGNYDSKEI